MKVKEIRTLPNDEVAAEMEKAGAAIFKARFQGKGEHVEKSGSLRTLRRKVARLKTILRERELAAETSPGGLPVKQGSAGAPGGES